VIELEQRKDGVHLPVKARAGGSKNAITGTHAGALKVMVTQAPEKGKANQAIVKLLAKSLGLQKSQVSLVSGQTSPQKMFLVEGVSATELHRRLELLLDKD
jgi:uncharacterized protein (TIGR00251 family)